MSYSVRNPRIYALSILHGAGNASSAREVMQKQNKRTFADIDGVHVIAEDIIIAASFEEVHDAILKHELDHACAKNIIFNKAKLQQKVSLVNCMGNVVTADGRRPCPRKVCAIVAMPLPNDKRGVQHLLGMVCLLSQFVPSMLSLTAPLRNLLKENVMWEWSPEADSAFHRLKVAISQPVLLKFFDISKPLTT